MFKSSKKKLLVSGCSYSAHWYTTKFGFPVWPEVLGKMLDMEVINLAQCGRGNEYIYSTILDCLTKENNIGLVIAMWSESNRIDFEVPDSPEKRRTRSKATITPTEQLPLKLLAQLEIQLRHILKLKGFLYLLLILQGFGNLKKI